MLLPFCMFLQSAEDPCCIQDALESELACCLDSPQGSIAVGVADHLVPFLEVRKVAVLLSLDVEVGEVFYQEFLFLGRYGALRLCMVELLSFYALTVKLDTGSDRRVIPDGSSSLDSFSICMMVWATPMRVLTVFSEVAPRDMQAWRAWAFPQGNGQEVIKCMYCHIFGWCIP